MKPMIQYTIFLSFLCNTLKHIKRAHYRFVVAKNMTQYWHFVNGESIQRDELEICGNPPNSLAKRRKICFFCPYQTKSYHTNGNGARIDKYKFYSCHNPTIFLITFNKHSSSHPRRDIYFFLLAFNIRACCASSSSAYPIFHPNKCNDELLRVLCSHTLPNLLCYCFKHKTLKHQTVGKGSVM